jgi:hypothetical protein
VYFSTKQICRHTAPQKGNPPASTDGLQKGRQASKKLFNECPPTLIILKKLICTRGYFHEFLAVGLQVVRPWVNLMF